MQRFIPVIRFEIWLVLAGLALIGAFEMLTGGIKMTGLRDDRATGGPSPGVGAVVGARRDGRRHNSGG